MVYVVRAYVVDEVHTYTVEADNMRQIPGAVYEKTGESMTTILNIIPLPRRKLKRKFKVRGMKVKAEELEFFCRQLQVLVESGETTLSALETLIDQCENKVFKEVIKEIADNVRAGFNMHSTMAKHEDIFSPIFYNSIKVAEEVGNFTETLGWLADKIKKSVETKRRVHRAILYPMIVIILAMVVTVGLFIFVVPKFVEMLEETGVGLPLLTRVVMGISQRMHIIIFIGLVVFFGLLMVLRYLKEKHEVIFSKVELLLIRLPVVGDIVKGTVLADFFWTLGILVESGILTPNALEMLAESTNFISFRHDIYRAKVEVDKGKKIYDGLGESEWVDNTSRKMILIGEESGKLGDISRHTSVFLEKRVDNLMFKLPTYLEVGTTVLVGVIVLIVLLALFLPYVDVMQNIQ